MSLASASDLPLVGLGRKMRVARTKERSEAAGMDKEVEVSGTNKALGLHRTAALSLGLL